MLAQAMEAEVASPMTLLPGSGASHGATSRRP